MLIKTKNCKSLKNSIKKRYKYKRGIRDRYKKNQWANKVPLLNINNNQNCSHTSVSEKYTNKGTTTSTHLKNQKLQKNERWLKDKGRKKRRYFRMNMNLKIFRTRKKSFLYIICIIIKIYEYLLKKLFTRLIVFANKFFRCSKKEIENMKISGIISNALKDLKVNIKYSFNHFSIPNCVSFSQIKSRYL